MNHKFDSTSFISFVKEDEYHCKIAHCTVCNFTVYEHPIDGIRYSICSKLKYIELDKYMTCGEIIMKDICE